MGGGEGWGNGEKWGEWVGGRVPKNRGGDPRGTGGWGGTGAPRRREAGPSCSRPGGAEPLRPQEPSLYTVKALLVLDSRGQRLLAKVRPGPGPGPAAVASPLPPGGSGSGSGHRAEPPAPPSTTMAASPRRRSRRPSRAASSARPAGQAVSAGGASAAGGGCQRAGVPGDMAGGQGGHHPASPQGRSPAWRASPWSTGAAATSSSAWWGAPRRTRYGGLGGGADPAGPR